MRLAALLPCALVLVAACSTTEDVVQIDMETMTAPTDHHARVLSAVGQWEGSLESFGPGLGEDPIPARQTVQAVGPFWTQTRFECDLMGMSYVGEGTLGYDPLTRTYRGTWADSWSSYLAVMEGEWDADREVLVMRWDAPDMNGVMNAHRYELAQTDTTYVSTFYMGPGEGEKSMVISMKRAD